MKKIVGKHVVIAALTVLSGYMTAAHADIVGNPKAGQGKVAMCIGCHGIPDYRTAYPEVELTLQVSIPLLDVIGEDADLEVRFGPGGYTDREYRLAATGEVTPACSPGYLAENGPFTGFRTLAEVSQARFVRSPLEPWSTWFSACGLSLPEPDSGAQCNDLGLVYDAAAAGFGVALVRLDMGAAWFDSGRLLRLSTRSVPSPNANYICWKPGTMERWECAAFVDWLVQGAGAPASQEISKTA